MKWSKKQEDIGGELNYTKAMSNTYVEEEYYTKEKKSIQEELKRNKEICNTHVGEECYILGNGPSLAKVDLEKLSNKYVITCNSFCKNSSYYLAKTNMHVVVDDAYFDMRKDFSMKDELEDTWKLIEGLKCKVVVPVAAEDYIRKNNLQEKMDLYYIDISESDIINREFTDENWKVDLEDTITSYSNVVQFCIVIAIYMGFSKINLLGCETTNLLNILNRVLKNPLKNAHSYKNDRAESYFDAILSKQSLSDIIYWESFNYLGYEKLYELCQKRGVRLVNMTEKSLIDTIPFEKSDLYIR